MLKLRDQLKVNRDGCSLKKFLVQLLLQIYGKKKIKI